MPSFHLDVCFVSAFYVYLLALTRYFMIKQTLNIVPLINGLPIFLSELFYLKIKDHRKGEIHGSYQERRDSW